VTREERERERALEAEKQRQRNLENDPFADLDIDGKFDKPAVPKIVTAPVPVPASSAVPVSKVRNQYQYKESISI
jgi:hypothetical protein